MKELMQQIVAEIAKKSIKKRSLNGTFFKFEILQSADYLSNAFAPLTLPLWSMEIT